MNFAYWKNISGAGVEIKIKASPGRGPFPVEHQVVELFVVDIPEGTTQTEIVEKLRANNLLSGSPDGMGFEDEWPNDIRQQRDTPLKLVAWSGLN
jgi:hypothetical protein